MNHSYFDTFWNNATKQTDSSDEIIEHGWEQHVILDHANRLVYRYPRDQAAANKLVDEVGLLAELHTQTWPLEIPKMRDHNEHFAVYDLIEGEVLSPEKLATIDQEEIARIGHVLGTFLAQLHGFDPSVVQNKKTKQTMTLLEYYAKRIDHGKDTSFYEHARQDLATIKSEEPPALAVVHGDLHGLNMVINPRNNTLVGVIDFSEVEIGDPHQDFRKLYMTDERLLDPAITSYSSTTGMKLSKQRVMTWAFVNEWANVCYFAHKTNHPTYQRAIDHLRIWGKV